MATLKQVDKVNVRKEVINPSTGLKLYITGDYEQRVNVDLILKILQDYGIDAGGNKIHRIIFNNNKDLFVNDAGLAQVLA